MKISLPSIGRILLSESVMAEFAKQAPQAKGKTVTSVIHTLNILTTILT